MQKIKRLSPLEAKKIAAGEVIERPANAIKELIENSIDAGAQNISIYLESAGKKLIRIIDDGCGMSEQDAILCFEQHATSKITSVDDLNKISTFGFRGEALSSIASVSKVKLTTKLKESIEGTNVNLEASDIKSKQNIACNNGTEIEISEVFYNVPARLKFLKKDETELRQIIQIFQAFCLSYKEIHFKFFHENKLIYNCPAANDLRSRIVQLWDHNLEQDMLELNFVDEKENLTLKGLVSDTKIYRYNRSQIFFFVNGRWIKNQHLSRAIIKGYSNVLPKDRFPVAFIFIQIPQEKIDVNIHPRKEEVQFENPKRIENVIQNLVTKSLEKSLSKNLNENFNFIPTNTDDNYQSRFIAATETTFDFEQLPFFEPLDKQNNQSNILLSEQQNLYSSQNLHLNNVDQKSSGNEYYKILGQFDNCYILLEKNDGLFIVDQHAAHERILYELFSKKFADIARVKLIFPIFISLSNKNMEVILPYLDVLKQYGIEVEIFNETQLIVNSIPVHLKDVKLDELINQLIGWIEELIDIDKKEFFKLINEKLCAQMACKAAVKSGDKLNNEQLTQLLDDLQKTDNRFVCPHGRPTSWLLSSDEIEKKFKRNYR